MENKYVKIVYQSKPIGPEKIILYLTTFDIDKYSKDLERKEFAIGVDMPSEKYYELNNINISEIEKRLNDYVKNFYAPYIEEIKTYLKLLKTTYTMEPKVFDNIKNVNNVEKITCNNIYGNVNNCEVLYCNEIHGKVNNVEKIVYKKH